MLRPQKSTLCSCNAVPSSCCVQQAVCLGCHTALPADSDWPEEVPPPLFITCVSCAESAVLQNALRWQGPPYLTHSRACTGKSRAHLESCAQQLQLLLLCPQRFLLLLLSARQLLGTELADITT